ncbi:glucose-6-phosphate isomerase [Pseudophaeobacter flagellatus]|uniref:glucose-6-phosphate isomerase n=1 Tax=Pseudophaeobacter flagellatus TaxID=2899119 RepID=UPI001E2934DD|nr:glucose-6-phosphate isomerase [Pseudophaeobacter flagellatus]MCD9149106.1 glucose-6-phosphate isomerase [Pseudophaeobacter flagellatus]
MDKYWAGLTDHRRRTSEIAISKLFQDDPQRFQAFSAEADGMLLDYSKTALDETALAGLIELAEQAGLADRIAEMFRGDAINVTEKRPALHTALRAPGGAVVEVDGEDVMPGVRHTLERMEGFAGAVRSGAHKSATGARFTDVVNIGIGGSDLGPVMATLALAPYHDGPRCHYVSNVDGADITDCLKGLDPQTTLIIIASKSFGTIETMTNAATAITWLRGTLGEQASQHLVAVSSAQDRTAAFGIPPERVFGFADWVGGRYSLWGPVGLPVLLAVGRDNFRAMLSGAAAMDCHFQTADLRQNLPVLLGLIGIWHSNICGYATRAILPYDQRLARLPAYLQQLDMESNGKGVTLEGAKVSRASGPIVWGEPGTNGQHAFYQLLHQGTHVVPTEFLIAATGHEPELSHQHDLLKANCLAQSKALMAGRLPEQARALAESRGHTGTDLERMTAHLTFPGNRPSVTLAYPRLTPFVLGQIIALYEHRVFTEGAIWGINSFDQWGVELGKELAESLLPLVQGGKDPSKDSSTLGLVAKLSVPKPAI